MKFAPIAFAVLVFFASSAAFAQVEQKDITADVAEHMKKHFVGSQVKDGPTVIKRHKPKGPLGTPLPGWEDRASGSAKIEKLEKIEGKISRITVKDLDLSLVTADCKMVFTYSGQTSCDRISSPGGAVIDHPWGSLHPKGTITLHLRIEKQKNGKLTKETFIESGHGDRPNAYIRDILATLLAARAEDLLQDNLGVEIESN